MGSDKKTMISDLVVGGALLTILLAAYLIGGFGGGAVFFSTVIIVAAFIPLFTMQGVEGQIFGPMARTYGYALVGALIATFTVTPCLASLLLPEHVNEVETLLVRTLRSI
jgi:Cu/Ag efflux pump CusA